MDRGRLSGVDREAGHIENMRYIRLTAVLLLVACGDGGTTPTSPPTTPTPPTPVATSITLSATSLSFFVYRGNAAALRHGQRPERCDYEQCRSVVGYV